MLISSESFNGWFGKFRAVLSGGRMQRDMFPKHGLDEKSALLLHLDVHQAIELDEFANTFKGMAYMYLSLIHI